MSNPTRNMAGFISLQGIFLAVFFMVCCVSSSEGSRFIVGGANGWVVHPAMSYNHWAKKNRFFVNDTLYFKFDKVEDSVLRVTNQGYRKCNETNPMEKFDSGEVDFVLGSPGRYYFITGNVDHCHEGQRLIVRVTAVTSPPHPAEPPSSSAHPPVSVPPHHTPTVSPHPIATTPASPPLPPLPLASQAPPPQQPPAEPPSFFAHPPVSVPPHHPPTVSLPPIATTPASPPLPPPPPASQAPPPQQPPAASPPIPSKPPASPTPAWSPSPTPALGTVSPTSAPTPPSKPPSEPIPDGKPPEQAPAPAPAGSAITSPTLVTIALGVIIMGCFT